MTPRSPLLPDAETTATLAALLDRVQAECGLTFPPERRPDMETAARRAMVRAGVRELPDYLAKLSRGALPLSDVIDEVTIRETYFFREPDQFAHLREVVVPMLLEERPVGEIRCWSAGCASGEEAYSLAILLDEMGLSSRTHIVGTDVSRAALVSARAARYRPWSLRGEDAFRARRWLTEVDGEHQLAARIRRLVTFGELNLVEGPASSQTALAALVAGGTFDIVMCRNVLVYFDERALSSAVKVIYDSLAPGGWLIPASSDPPLGSYAPFLLVPTRRGTFYRKRPAVPSRFAGPAEGRLETAQAPPAAATLAAGAWLSGLSLVSPSLPSGKPVQEDALPEATVLPSSPKSHERANASRILSVDELSALVASGSVEAAEAALETAMAERPLVAELAFLSSVVHVERRRDELAIASLRRAIYLDARFVTAHLALGLALLRGGDAEGARRSLRTVGRLCAELPKTQIVPFTGGATAERVAETAARQARALSSKGAER